MSKEKKLKRKVRNSYIISTISIALVLFLLGSVGYLILSALDVTDKMKENISVYVMLKDNTTEEQKQNIKKNLLAQEAVRDAVFVSKDEAAEEFRRHEGSDFDSFLEFNPLPDSYEVKLSAAGPDIEKMSAFEKEAMKWEGVDEVVYQRSIVEEIGRNINKFNIILLTFGAALLLISIILLNNTIRVTIFSKRYIISTMKLVGATKGFIRKPFIRSAILQGINSAFIATLMFAGLVWGLHEGLPELNFKGDQIQAAWIIGGMFVTGILISLLFTIFAVNKFIKLPTGAIHYY